ncbi:LON peptidase substrate-binding domain-containing protein [Pseudogemmobacter sonorensis]|uniref:LON peptidase substrate-binding domain-containing protein n=1 Tax=Pseudogemmobacter sonorensis TaxID=2989681 RepID=UPI0036B1DFA3
MAFHPGPADLPGVLALFPLPGALLLPRVHLPLNIFEPRYLAMVEDVLRAPHRMIGMIRPIGTGLADPQPQDARLSSIGCAGRITRFHEMEDGRMTIFLTGIARFRLRDEMAGFTPYRRAEVDWTSFHHDLEPPAPDPDFDLPTFTALIARYLDSVGMVINLESLTASGEERMVNALSLLCPFPPEDKQALLEAPGLSTRRETLVALIEYAMRGGLDTGLMQ